MSRSFPGGTGNYFLVGDVPAIDITGTVLSLHMFALSNVASATQRGIDKLGGVGDRQYELSQVANIWRFSVSDGSNTDFIDSNATVQTGRWTAVGGRKNGTGVNSQTIFLNGTIDKQQTSTLSMVNTTANLNLGADAQGGVNGWNGLLAECAIWDVALLDSEFAALASGTTALSIQLANLKGYWPLCGIQTPEPDFANSNYGSQIGSVPSAAHPLLNALCNTAPAPHYSGRGAA